MEEDFLNDNENELEGKPHSELDEHYGIVRDENGKFVKGNGGRPKNNEIISSRKKDKLRKKYIEVLEKNSDKIDALLDEVKEKEGAGAALRLMVQIANSVLPRLKTELDNSDAENEIIVVGGDLLKKKK